MEHGRRDAGLLWSVSLFVLFYPRAASAYIDPGTGSALIYVVTGVVVSLYFFVRGLGYRVAERVLRRRYRHQSCELTLHCESPRYEITFLPVMRALSDRGIQMTFFTMYPRNHTYEPLPAGVTHHEIAPGMVGYSYLNNLEAKVLVTTTPQLDVMTFRRSKRVRHYVMIAHALGESRYVRPYAYDFFDSVLCCGEVLKKNIRRMEALRDLPAKRLYDTGIPHYDELLKHADKNRVGVRTQRPQNPSPLVLIAPSWGPLSIFQAFGTDLVRYVAAKYAVVVRPHPQMKISQKALYEEVLGFPGVEVDTSRTPAEAMSRADILISDISGIMHEFAFIYEKPVIIVDHKIGLGGLEGQLLGGESELKERCRDFIIPVPPSEMEAIPDRIDAALRLHTRERIVNVREKTVYNYGRAGAAAAEHIVGILACP